MEDFAPRLESFPVRFLVASEPGRTVVTPTDAFSPSEFRADEAALSYLRSCISRINKHLSKGVPLEGEDLYLAEMLRPDRRQEAPVKEGKCGGGCSCSVTAEHKSVELFLLLAQFCNLGCVYCLDGSETYQTSRHLRMSPEVSRLAIDRIVETLRPGDTLNVTFFGGEPLLNWPTAKSTIEYARMVCLEKLVSLNFGIQTNLTFLPRDFISAAKDENITIICSLDGPEGVHNALRPHRDKSANSYRMTCSRLAELRAGGVPFQLRATITSLNVKLLPEIADLHASLGAGGTIFGMLRPVNSDGFVFDISLAPDLDDLEASFRRLHLSHPEIFEDVTNGILSRMRPEGAGRACGAAYMNTPTVDANGDVYSCSWFVGQPEKLIGNLRDRTFLREEAVASNYQEFDNRQDPVCSACDYYAVCKGGCAATRLASGGGEDAERAISIMRGQQCTLVKTVVDGLLLSGV
ncbi:SPASM domain-containing protein [Sinorhizobium meliloti]|nr:SPASM domain-containing protein [Sinorhizobium meliloti]